MIEKLIENKCRIMIKKGNNEKKKMKKISYKL
jgi:uncharacterized membrane protein YcaP (DUF421 family)